jgi:hypothetical protein
MMLLGDAEKAPSASGDEVIDTATGGCSQKSSPSHAPPALPA